VALQVLRIPKILAIPAELGYGIVDPAGIFDPILGKGGQDHHLKIII
jgi:hypothetical protein